MIFDMKKGVVSMKRKLSIFLILIMCFTLIPSIVSAAELPFKDVPTNAWYYSDVKNAYGVA